MVPFGEVNGRFAGDDVVFIVGGGPSLRGFDFNRLEGRSCVGVNQSMFDAPCSIGVSMDYKFIANKHKELCEFIKKGNTLYLVLGRNWCKFLLPVPGATYVLSSGLPGLSLDPSVVNHGCTSGFSAFNVAVLRRPKKIFLLGFDYGPREGLHHYHDAYDWHKQVNKNWVLWSKSFNSAAPTCEDLEIEVLNASPDSLVTAFKKIPLEESLLR